MNKEVKTILDIALELHMQNNGSMDFQDDFGENLKRLEIRLRDWKSSLRINEAFDNAVKNLLEIVVDECQIKKQ